MELLINIIRNLKLKMMSVIILKNSFENITRKKYYLR